MGVRVEEKRGRAETVVFQFSDASHDGPISMEKNTTRFSRPKLLYLEVYA